MIFIPWFILSCMAAWLGDKRKIGGAWAFVLSLLLSPVIGFIACLISDPLNKPNVPQSSSLAKEIEHLNDLKVKGVISEEEFNNMKNKLIQKTT